MSAEMDLIFAANQEIANLKERIERLEGQIQRLCAVKGKF